MMGSQKQHHGLGGSALRVAAAAASVAAFWGTPAAGQQFVTDDAAVADLGACELEAWVGEEESWILPICRPSGPAELTAGAIFADLGGDSREALFVGEVKTLLAEVRGWSTGVVAGAAVPTDSELARPHEVFAYLPATRPLDTLPATAHLNLGWALTREGPRDDTDTDHHLMWAAKLGVDMAPRVAVIGEVFGLGTDEVDFQGGVRTELIRDRLTVDASYGGAFRSGHEGLGLQLGAHWTPRPWFRRTPGG